MKIILKKEVANLGEPGDVVEVKPGYALNFLIPKGFAVSGTPAAIKQHEETVRQRAHKEAKLVADAEALAKQIEEMPIKVAVKVSETGKIYGSVTAAQLAEALHNVGIEIDKKNITVPDDVKKLGEYEASVKCYKQVFATLKFEVVSE